MGKASKWFRALLALKRPDSPSSSASPAPKPPKEKRRWTFVKSYRENKHHHNHHPHATALHSAAAIAEAAVARLASDNGGRGAIARQEWAAVKIQSAFRGCLARRALRALKGLVKLQALVRGHIERKRTAEWLQRMQTLLRAQARARAGRAKILQRAKSSSTANLHGPATPDKFESPIRSASMKYDQSSSVLKRNGSKSRLQNGSDIMANERSWNQRRSWTRTCSMDNEKSAKILEIDSGKPHLALKRRNLFYSASQPLVSDYYTSYQSVQSSSSFEVQSYSPLKINEVEESSICGANDNSDGSKRSPITPTKSDGSRSYLSSYSDYPSYMAYTESSKAKVRSLSAPRQRPQYERSCSYNRHSLHGIGESRSAAQRASFTSKAYPGSGHLDNLGLPVGYRY